MLQIYIFGPLDEGFLDINPGTLLEMETMYPLFNEDLEIGEYSLPIEIPWTERNRKLMGHNERHQNFTRKNNYFTCHVYDNLLPELQNAKLTLLDRSGDYGYRRGSFNASISGNKGLFGSLIKNKKLTDLNLGGKIEWTGLDSRQFAEQHTRGLWPQYSYINFAPIAFQNFFDTSRTDYDDEFLAMETVNNALSIRPGLGLWTFGRPNPINPDQPLVPGAAGYNDYRTIPFFSAKYVLRKCFEEHGFTVAGDFLSSNDFDDMYLFNNYSIEYYAKAPQLDFNRSIFPKDHVPDISVREFIRRTCSFFNMYPVFDNFKCTLKYRKAVFTDRRQASITNLISGDFTTTPADVNNEKGYKLNYEWDSADSYPSDHVKDPAEKTLVATILMRSQLGLVNPGFQLTTDHIVFIEAENLFYVVADATSNPIKWEVWTERLSELTVDEGEKTVTLPASTLCQYVVKNTTTALMERKPYLACSQLGSYYSNSGVRVKNPFDLRFFYSRFVPFNDQESLPCTFAHNRSYANQTLAPYSLALDGVEGLNKQFYQRWLKFLQQAETTAVALNLDRRSLNELDNSSEWEAANIIYFPSKMERTIPLQTTVDVEMIAL